MLLIFTLYLLPSFVFSYLLLLLFILPLLRVFLLLRLTSAPSSPPLHWYPFIHASWRTANTHTYTHSRDTRKPSQCGYTHTQPTKTHTSSQRLMNVDHATWRRRGLSSQSQGHTTTKVLVVVTSALYLIDTWAACWLLLTCLLLCAAKRYIHSYIYLSIGWWFSILAHYFSSSSFSSFSTSSLSLYSIFSPVNPFLTPSGHVRCIPHSFQPFIVILSPGVIDGLRSEWRAWSLCISHVE